MFGYIEANIKALSDAELARYRGCYCGLCRSLKARHGQLSRITLTFDMTFLVMLLSSMYEPEETSGEGRCFVHPAKKRFYWQNRFSDYAADMNVALAYYNAQDDWEDDGKYSARMMMGVFGKNYEQIAQTYPRQCAAIESCIRRLSKLEKENCPNPDEPANCFGQLMGEILVYREDLWAPILRDIGRQLGRFIYLADAARDYRTDEKKKKYNPYIAMGSGEDWPRWEEYLVLAMSGCTREFEKLPLVQDKDLLDNILYSGVWVNLRRKEKKEQEDRK